MAKKTDETAKKESEDFMPLKVRRKTWRLLKTLAGWREMNLADYLDELIAGRISVKDDLKKAAGELNDLQTDYS